MSLSWYSGFTALKGSEVGIQFRFPKTYLPSLVIVNYKLLGFWKNNQGSENKTVIVIFILFLFPQKLKLCPKVAAELNQQGRLSRGHIRNKQGDMKWSIWEVNLFANGKVYFFLKDMNRLDLYTYWQALRNKIDSSLRYYLIHNTMGSHDSLPNSQT